MSKTLYECKEKGLWLEFEKSLKGTEGCLEDES